MGWRFAGVLGSPWQSSWGAGEIPWEATAGVTVKLLRLCVSLGLPLAPLAFTL